jgi:hypothetical protein
MLLDASAQAIIDANMHLDQCLARECLTGPVSKPWSDYLPWWAWCGGGVFLGFAGGVALSFAR